MTTDDLLHLTDTAVLEQAIGDRRRRRLLAAADADDADIAGTLQRLVELHADITVTTLAGTSLHGTLVEVGPEHLIVRDRRAGDRIVPLRALASVRTRTGASPPPTDATAVVSTIGLAEVLRDLAVRGDAVHLVALDGSTARGRLTQVGRDVVRVASPDGALLVPLHAVAQIGPTDPGGLW